MLLGCVVPYRRCSWQQLPNGQLSMFAATLLLGLPAWPACPACLPACLPACSNVLLSRDLRASIADLGVAQALASSACTVVGFTRASACECMGGGSAQPRQQENRRQAATARGLCSCCAGNALPRLLGALSIGLTAAPLPMPPAPPAPAAAAPEQLLGQRCTLAADLYSFGLLLIELTTQQLVTGRGKWRWPLVPQECPQARTACCVAAVRAVGALSLRPLLQHTVSWQQPACSLGAR